MRNSISIGQYIVGDSVLHRADPRTKILLTIALIVTVIMLGSYVQYGLCAALILLCVLVSGVNIRLVLRGLKPVLFIVIFTALFSVFTVKGDVALSLWGLEISWQGLDSAAKVAIRVLLLVSGASILTYVTSPSQMTDGIESLLSSLKRLKVPVHEFALMMTIALRFIPTLMEELDKITKAQAARGADFDTGNVFERVKAYIPVIVPLLVSSFNRAADLATAMEARCYNGGEGRTKMRLLKFSGNDLIIVSSYAIFCILEVLVGILNF